MMFITKPMHEDVDIFVHDEPGEQTPVSVYDASLATLLRSLAALSRFKFGGPALSENVAKGVIKLSVGTPVADDVANNLRNNTGDIGQIAIPARILSAEQNTRLVAAISLKPAKIHVHYSQGDDEAYHLAEQIGVALAAGGWTLTDPVRPMRMVSKEHYTVSPLATRTSGAPTN